MVWLKHLRLDLGPHAVRTLREQAATTSKRRPMSVEEADARFRITKSGARYRRDFYLRLLRSMDRRLHVTVAWGRPPMRSRARSRSQPQAR